MNSSKHSAARKFLPSISFVFLHFVFPSSLPFRSLASFLSSHLSFLFFPHPNLSLRFSSFISAFYLIFFFSSPFLSFFISFLTSAHLFTSLFSASPILVFSPRLIYFLLVSLFLSVHSIIWSSLQPPHFTLFFLDVLLFFLFYFTLIWPFPFLSFSQQHLVTILSSHSHSHFSPLSSLLLAHFSSLLLTLFSPLYFLALTHSLSLSYLN